MTAAIPIERVEWTCPTAGCGTVVVFSEIKALTESLSRVDYDSPCRACNPLQESVDSANARIEAAIDELYALDEQMRNAQGYLTRAMLRRHRAKSRQRIRRWAHEKLHRVQYALGHKFCFACNELTHNDIRPASHYLNHPR